MQKQNKELHETIEEMSKNIRALQREFLEWDKKLRLAQREREKFQKEMESNGEIGAMKLEIHRMEVTNFIIEGLFFFYFSKIQHISIL